MCTRLLSGILKGEVRPLSMPGSIGYRPAEVLDALQLLAASGRM